MFNIILNGFHYLTIWLLKTSLRWGDEQKAFSKKLFLLSHIIWKCRNILSHNQVIGAAALITFLPPLSPVSIILSIYIWRGQDLLCWQQTIAKKNILLTEVFGQLEKNKRNNPYVTDIVTNWQIFKPGLVLQFLHWLSLWHWTKITGFHNDQLKQVPRN